MGKFARQICNKFTGVQILCKSRWKFARVQINIQIYSDLFLRDHPSAGMVIAGDFNKLNLSSLCRQFNLRKAVKAPTRARNVLVTGAPEDR